MKLLISLPNFNGATVEVLEGISNFIPHYRVDVITYPYTRIKIKTIFVKVAPGIYSFIPISSQSTSLVQRQSGRPVATEESLMNIGK